MDDKENSVTNPKKSEKDRKIPRNSATSLPENPQTTDRKVSPEASLAAQERIARRKEAKENQDQISTKSTTSGGKVGEMLKTQDNRATPLDRRALAERRAQREAKLAEQEQALVNLKKNRDKTPENTDVSEEKPLDLRKSEPKEKISPKSNPDRQRERIRQKKSEKPQIIREKPQIIKEKPQIIKDKPQIIKDKPQIIKEKPIILSENAVEPVENQIIPPKKPENPALKFGGQRLQPPETVEKNTSEIIPKNQENPAEPVENSKKIEKNEQKKPLKPQTPPESEKEPPWSSILAWHGGFLSLPMVVLLYFVQHEFWLILGFIFVILDLFFTLRQSAPIETPEYHHCKECFALLSVEPLCPQCGAQNEVLLQWQTEKKLDGKFAQIRFRQYRVVLSYLLSISIFLAFWTFI